MALSSAVEKVRPTFGRDALAPTPSFRPRFMDLVPDLSGLREEDFRRSNGCGELEEFDARRLED